MAERLTIVLWRSTGPMFETRLLDRPLWHWTLESARALKPDRMLLVREKGGDAEAEGVVSLTPSQLGSVLSELDGKVIVLSAELPCVRASTLRRLLAASRNASRCFASRGEGRREGCPIVSATTREAASAVNQLRGRSRLGSLYRLLRASPDASAPPEDLLLVRTAADWAAAAQILRRRKGDSLLSAGVLLDDPATVHVDPRVQIGRGTRIHRWVVIEGASRIGARCEIGSFSHIVDSVIGSGTLVLDHCFIRSSRIGRAAQLGPFAHLRPESVMETGSKVGNFVEMKKSILGRGSKAPHLTYLGDARVGARVNVGAGTITCNYDGERKHETIIEDGVFI